MQREEAGGERGGGSGQKRVGRKKITRETTSYILCFHRPINFMYFSGKHDKYRRLSHFNGYLKKFKTQQNITATLH